SPPTALQFVGLPAEVNKNSPFTVTATGMDAESGIAKATFFLAKPVDNKIPPQAATVAGVPVATDNNTWTASLPLSALPKGPAETSVEFVNAAGLGAFATASVNLLDADPKPPSGPGRIHGVVLEGGRPQADLEVALTDSKAKDGKEKEAEKKKTAADGTF